MNNSLLFNKQIYNELLTHLPKVLCDIIELYHESADIKINNGIMCITQEYTQTSFELKNINNFQIKLNKKIVDVRLFSKYMDSIPLYGDICCKYEPGAICRTCRRDQKQIMYLTTFPIYNDHEKQLELWNKICSRKLIYEKTEENDLSTIAHTTKNNQGDKIVFRQLCYKPDYHLVHDYRVGTSLRFIYQYYIDADKLNEIKEELMIVNSIIRKL
jgi:hypothetical protein